MELHLSYSYWYILLCAIVAAVGALLLYYKDKQSGLKKQLKLLLAGLRGLSLFFILLLLLNPVLKWLKNKENKPIIAVLADNSNSQKAAFKKMNQKTYERDLNDLVSNLEKDYVVKKYTYGTALNDSFKLNYSENTSNLSQALEEINAAYENENLGSIILTGDGIYNQGINPAAVNLPIKCPIYAVGVGDTTLKKDILISRVFANKVVHLNDQFAIKVDVSAFSAPGEKSTLQIQHINSGKNEGLKSLLVNSQRFNQSSEFILQARTGGLQHYRISVSTLSGEENTTNNVQDIFVEVIDNKEKVLIAYNAPHPDVNALREILGGLKNNNVDVVQADKIKENANAYNLIVLHNLPSSSNAISTLLQQAKSNNISTLFVLGSQSSIPAFTQTQNAVNIKSGAGGQTDATASLNKSFNLFGLPLQVANSFAALPPLSIPFGQYKVGNNTQSLLFQKIGAVQTESPLFVLQQNGSQRIGVLVGEGIWRWRMYDYLQHKNHNLVDDLFSKAIQYLVVKQDKRKFKAQVAKSVFANSEAIVFDAELYNDNYELINSPEVSLNVSGGAGKNSNYTFNKNDKSYSLNIGALAAGNYTYTAKTNYSGNAYSATGSFTVQDINIENANTVADFSTLYQLAKNYNGDFVYANQLPSLYNKIKNNTNIKTLIKSEVENEPLIDWKWIFGLITALLAIEWFLRKRNGAY